MTEIDRETSDPDDAEAVLEHRKRLRAEWRRLGVGRPCHVHPDSILFGGLGGPECDACEKDHRAARLAKCLRVTGQALVERAARALDVLSAACFEALGPASSWGSTAKGNAEAIRSLGARDHDTWFLSRATDWSRFADRTDPDLAILALEAAGAIGDLARARDTLGTLFLMRDYSAAYHAGPWSSEMT